MTDDDLQLDNGETRSGGGARAQADLGQDSVLRPCLANVLPQTPPVSSLGSWTLSPRIKKFRAQPS